MVHVPRSNYKWKTFRMQDLSMILQHQEELYSLNFMNMNFDHVFFSNIREWYTEGIDKHHCSSNLLLNEQGTLIGFYLYQWNEGTVYLMQMFVVEAFRGRGFGNLLLEHYEQCGKEQGAASSFLHASSINEKAVAFYQQNGYFILNEELDEEGCPRYFMFKNLS
ncbi:MAG TPA: GNAT family N-acetyltransferase [Bacillota bacterium]|nr:GNAT family N-acetyltransferase [Bacillota bacterium]